MHPAWHQTGHPPLSTYASTLHHRPAGRHIHIAPIGLIERLYVVVFYTRIRPAVPVEVARIQQLYAPYSEFHRNDTYIEWRDVLISRVPSE